MWIIANSQDKQKIGFIKVMQHTYMLFLFQITIEVDYPSETITYQGCSVVECDVDSGTLQTIYYTPYALCNTGKLNVL